MSDAVRVLEGGFENLRHNAPLGAVGWFRTGGTADALFRPKTKDELQTFLASGHVQDPITTLGALSNTIVRDGGVRGTVIRLGKDFAAIEQLDETTLYAGAAALDGNVAMTAAKCGIEGLEYLSGVPGSIGGAVRMNAGAYGTETKDILISADVMTHTGEIKTLRPADLNMRYRRTDLPGDVIVLGATLRGQRGNPDTIKAAIQEIKARRQETQPIREKTGGSTFANPALEDLEAAGLSPETKTWQLIDQAGGRGLRIGGAMMSELHCNFMINTGDATANDLESLGEEIIKRVFERTGVRLRWEIRRIGDLPQGQ